MTDQFTLARRRFLRHTARLAAAALPALSGAAAMASVPDAVSYTHLTLPTIYSV